MYYEPAASLKQFLSHWLRENFNNDCPQMLVKGAVLVHWSEVTNITIRNMTSHSLKTEVRGSDGKSLLDFFPSFWALHGLGQLRSNGYPSSPVCVSPWSGFLFM